MSGLITKYSGSKIWMWSSNIKLALFKQNKINK